MGRFEQIPPGAPVFHARNADFWYHDGVIFGRHTAKHPNVTLDDAIVAYSRISAMTGGEPRPLLMDGRGIAWISVEARAYVRAAAPEVFTEIAIIVKHDLVRILSHALLGVAGLEIPLEIFTDEDQAWQYLTASV